MEERDSITEIDPSLGLTDEQVQSRTPAGKPVYSGKSEKEIVLTHCFTFFNLIFVILAVMLIIGGSSPLNMGFLVVAVINTVIGIIHERDFHEAELEDAGFEYVPDDEVEADLADDKDEY